MLQLLLFWAVLLWFGWHFWVLDTTGNKKKRIGEIVLGIVYIVGGSVIIATAEDALTACCGSFGVLIGIYYVSGASSEPLPPWDAL